MIRLLIACTCTVALVVGCAVTRKQADTIKKSAATVGSFFGIPRPIGEAVAGAALLAFGHIHGHRRGRKRERAALAAPKA